MDIAQNEMLRADGDIKSIAVTVDRWHQLRPRGNSIKNIYVRCTINNPICLFFGRKQKMKQLTPGSGFGDADVGVPFGGVSDLPRAD